MTEANDKTNKITMTLQASTPEGLETLVAGLAARFGGYEQLAGSVELTATATQPLPGESNVELAATATQPLPGESNAEADVKPPKTRKKAKAKPEAEAPEPETEKAPSANTVSDLTPEQMRKQGIEKLMAWFGLSGDPTGQLPKLQSRYGVKMFKDLPDDQTAAFLADVHLLVNGTTQVG